MEWGGEKHALNKTGPVGWKLLVHQHECNRDATLQRAGGGGGRGQSLEAVNHPLPLPPPLHPRPHHQQVLAPPPSNSNSNYTNVKTPQRFLKLVAMTPIINLVPTAHPQYSHSHTHMKMHPVDVLLEEGRPLYVWVGSDAFWFLTDCESAYTFRLPPEGARLLQRLQENQEQACAGACADWLDENRPLLLPTCRMDDAEDRLNLLVDSLRHWCLTGERFHPLQPSTPTPKSHKDS